MAVTTTTKSAKKLQTNPPNQLSIQQNGNRPVNIVNEYNLGKINDNISKTIQAKKGNNNNNKSVRQPNNNNNNNQDKVNLNLITIEKTNLMNDNNNPKIHQTINYESNGGGGGGRKDAYKDGEPLSTPSIYSVML